MIGRAVELSKDRANKRDCADCTDRLGLASQLTASALGLASVDTLKEILADAKSCFESDPNDKDSKTINIITTFFDKHNIIYQK